MKLKIKKKDSANILLILFMSIGFVLILDGIVSIYLQPTQSTLFQSGRIARTIMGFIILFFSFMTFQMKNKKKKNKKKNKKR